LSAGRQSKTADNRRGGQSGHSFEVFRPGDKLLYDIIIIIIIIINIFNVA